VNETVSLSVEGEVQQELGLTFAALRAISADGQIDDISQVDPRYQGRGVSLASVLAMAGLKPSARYLTLHASADDFHASIPLSEVIQRGYLLYCLDDEPLPLSKGGPVRFLVRDSANCQVDEIDECANVKFVDRLELSEQRGQDNRPSSEEDHEELHRRQGS
jgi:DMSO/TMAO reductase YedYZ molybdopterin-dependent catalytic subunit